mmetsp:Transcript_4926/g.14380  ORF Transcript_4926/g.14380 Transcript_4926/m.14380 type:complete len:209 (-) Transcript_4926:25-651(-)
MGQCEERPRRHGRRLVVAHIRLHHRSHQPRHRPPLAAQRAGGAEPHARSALPSRQARQGGAHRGRHRRRHPWPGGRRPRSRRRAPLAGLCRGPPRDRGQVARRTPPLAGPLQRGRRARGVRDASAGGGGAASRVAGFLRAASPSLRPGGVDPCGCSHLEARARRARRLVQGLIAAPVRAPGRRGTWRHHVSGLGPPRAPCRHFDGRRA